MQKKIIFFGKLKVFKIKFDSTLSNPSMMSLGVQQGSIRLSFTGANLIDYMLFG